MAANRTLISETDLRPFVFGTSPACRAQGLLAQQKGAWQMLRSSYDGLRSVRTRVFPFEGFEIRVQFNPGRLVSTAAKVDANSIRERRCFLCLANLPPDQRGFLSEDGFLVLCNPFPIFPEHFTISCLDHVPQRIRPSFPAFLNLARALGERYVVFYNGPKCGASAPDHLHFQAGERAFLPIEAEYPRLLGKAKALRDSGALRAFSVSHCLRPFVAFESADAEVLNRAFEALYGALQANVPDGEEPMVNVLGFFQDGGWRIIVFPRAKHRPSFYFIEGPEKLLVSPAAVELGGVCTTPREQDFDRITAEHIQQIFQEVCLPAEQFATVQERLATLL